MLFYKLLIALISVYGALAIVNGRCSSGNGVCISTSSCTKAGGTYVSGKCPDDPGDIKCCNKNSCTVSGKTGKSLAGACPGPSNFQCCVDEVIQAKCSYQGIDGKCMNWTECNGFRVQGLCPGNGNIQCCLPKSPCFTEGKVGYCIPTAQCHTKKVAGKCPGGKDIQCYISKDEECLGHNFLNLQVFTIRYVLLEMIMLVYFVIRRLHNYLKK
ncbi:hypothetical protein BCR32DRAFT_296909 [Anaeromyces robustus]|uniref:Uncharacterized protein n=1 Tax=Anaeromyces robustus TaxID=1754192 RepID=A0A1Y1WPX8_9FUNG|nr:hypothetical protein BCR32DRAFT_296909 [Anaeromyces robustus]|eukprot:ORX75435.1 hypothetical protein BCR32DRAFT_296909 [Anaeromyces robustus]